MELNAEEIKEALKHAERTKINLERCKYGNEKPNCSECDFKPWIKPICQRLLCYAALELITSQEQRIKELTEENEAWQKRLIATEEKADKAYYELACEVENLRTESDRLKARTVDALTEFAESVKRYYSALPGATVGAAVRFYVDEKLKEALDKI